MNLTASPRCTASKAAIQIFIIDQECGWIVENEKEVEEAEGRRKRTRQIALKVFRLLLERDMQSRSIQNINFRHMQEIKKKKRKMKNQTFQQCQYQGNE